MTLPSSALRRASVAATPVPVPILNRRFAPASALVLLAALVLTPTAASAKDIPAEDGVYAVPAEVTPTTYRSTNASDQECTWTRRKYAPTSSNYTSTGVGGGMGQQIATIKSSDKGFGTFGCAAWVPLSTLPTSPRNAFKAGTLSVQKQIQVNTYRSSTPDGSVCIFNRLRNFEGTETSSITGYVGGEGQQIVTIKSTDKGFESYGCGTWTKLGSTTKTQKTSFGSEGTYSVSQQLKPGTYKSSNRSGVYCSWARLRNFEKVSGSVIASGGGVGARTVTIKSSDKGFESFGCGTWKRVG